MRVNRSVRVNICEVVGVCVCLRLLVWVCECVGAWVNVCECVGAWVNVCVMQSRESV